MPFFFFSTKIYSRPLLENYNECKARLLAEHFPGYEHISIKEKWQQLIARFSQAVENQQPNPRKFLDQLDVFKNRRLEVDINVYTLSLTQVLHYFEDFYFLYVNQNRQYQLNLDEKKQLLSSIKDALPVCETGINGHFYALLQNYQKDDDWIVNALVKMRCNLIRLLHTQYETNHAVSMVFSVHVYNYFVILANQKGFALPMQEVIDDFYEARLNKDSMTTFFEQNFSECQTKYQQDMLTNLCQELMFSLSQLIPQNTPASSNWGLIGYVFSSLLPQNTPQTWGDESIEVPYDFYGTLTEFLTAHFKTFDTSKIAAILENLCTYDEDNNQFLMKGRREAQACLMESIKELLFNQEYFLSTDRLIAKPSLQSDALINPKCCVKDVLAIHQAFQAQDHKRIQKYSQTLRYYPEICIQALISNPMLYQYVSPYMKKDSKFIDAAVDEIQTLLQDALDNHQEEKIDNLIDLLDLVIAGESTYLKKISPRIRQEARIVLRFGDIEFPYYEFNDAVSMGDFFQALKVLSITDLMRINSERKQTYQAPIPFIDDYELTLKAFITEIRKDIVDSDTLDEHELKRKACEIENFKFLTNPFRLLSPISFLAKNRNIFEAFIEYQAYQSSPYKILHHLVELILNLLELAIYAFIAVLCIYLILKFSPLVAILIEPYIESLLSLAGFFYVLSLVNDSKILVLIAIGFLLGSTLNMGFNIFFLVVCAINLFYAAKELAHVFSNMFNLLITMIKTCHSFFFEETTFKNIEDSCDSIIFRLEMINEVSAMQKASVLRNIHQQMKQEFGENLIEKPYPIEYQGKQYQLSFKDVCNMSRASKDEFCIVESSGFMRFFRPSTVSMRELLKNPSTNRLLNAV